MLSSDYKSGNKGCKLLCETGAGSELVKICVQFVVKDIFVVFID